MGTLVFALALLCSTICNTVAAESRSRSRLAIKLIHRGSIPALPPINELESSMARAARFEAEGKGRAIPTTDDYRGHIFPGPHAWNFLVNVSIGQPLASQLIEIDTGSSLLWIPCTPCPTCAGQSTSLFDPSKSSSYVKGKCNTSYCTYLDPSESCDPQGQCRFTIEYADETKVTGIIGFDTVTFETSDEGTAPVADVVFGCAHQIQSFDNQLTGIMGLAPREDSLSSRLSPRFSYCIGDIHDPHYQYNQLILGDGAVIQGDSTPMDDFGGLYYMTLESISIGDKKLNIDPGVFKRQPSGDGGVIIDSGATYTMLIDEAYTQLHDAVKEVIGGKLQPVEDDLRLCYKGSVAHDLGGFPVITFHFADGAELGLDINSAFLDDGPDKLCMAVIISQAGKLNVIGIMAQQGYNVGYDYEGYKIYFQRIDCQLLASS